MTSTTTTAPTPRSSSHADLSRVARRSIGATLGGTLADLAAVVDAQAVNREAVAEPPATRGVGPAAFHATGEWLRAAFSDLAWTTECDVVDGELVVVVCDHGAGFGSSRRRRDDPGGLGLAIIAALTSRHDIASAPNMGTEIRMTFALGGKTPLV